MLILLRFPTGFQLKMMNFVLKQRSAGARGALDQLHVLRQDQSVMVAISILIDMNSVF